MEMIWSERKETDWLPLLLPYQPPIGPEKNGKVGKEKPRCDRCVDWCSGLVPVEICQKHRENRHFYLGD